jgi:ABC-type sugar transport system ATPase subunit
MADQPALVTVEGVSKRYPGIVALDDVSFDLRPGEVHALIGENGAGKSTLIKILSGVIRPDAGTVSVGGEPVDFHRPADARARGIIAIFQELAIEPWLSVADNVVLGAEPTIGPGRQILDGRAADRLTRSALGQLGAGDIKVRRRAGSLATGQKQLIEIARAVRMAQSVIIMDEPTASLPGREAEQLLSIVRDIRASGGTVLFVSHRLDEVAAIADRITVLRGGRNVVTENASEMPVQRMIELMIGRSLNEFFPPRNEHIGEPVLRVRNLTRAGAFEDVSFEVRGGEVLGFAGLIGAGRTEVMRAIAGADPLDSGEVEVGGRVVNLASPRSAIRAGIAYLPEDRKEQGLVLPLSGRENLVMASMPRVSRAGFLRRSALRSITDKTSRELDLRGRLDAPVGTLSGGNQQKIVLGKWLLSDAKVFIFDEPTRGIDVAAKQEVYRLMHDLAVRGAAVILVSSELPEVMNVAHRMLVMSGGRVQDELDRDEFDERRILAGVFAAHVSAGV